MGKFNVDHEKVVYEVPAPKEQEIPEGLTTDPAGIQQAMQDLRTGQPIGTSKAEERRQSNLEALALSKHGIDINTLMDDIAMGKECQAVLDDVRESLIKTEEKEEELVLADDQAIALDDIINGEYTLFHLTGQAGSGKSFLVNYLRKHYRCATTATTAVAAQLIEGSTVHRLTGYWDGTYNQPPRFNARKLAEALTGYDYWIIDECSMMSKRMFECLYEGMKLVMARGVKVIMVGDFLQLPPVPSRNRDPHGKKWHTAFDSDQYAFTSPYWSVPDYTTGYWVHTNVRGINLQYQHRQSDLTFIRALNLLRRGAMTDELRDIITNHLHLNLPEDCTILAPLKREVNSINDARLAKIESDKFTFTAEVEPQEALSKVEGMRVSQSEIDKLTKTARVPLTLELKIGARIMMLMNNDLAGYINGTGGEIEEIDLMEDVIHVRRDDGTMIAVRPESEFIHDHNGKPLLRIIQYPMMLAFAVTIHKSQGCTIDRAGIILDGHFAAGQTYVAMSRVRSSEGLFCKGYIPKIITDPWALNYLTGNGWLD